MSLSPRKVVRFFSSAKGIVKSSFAKHSSAKEFDIISTPSKSSITKSLSCIIGSNIFLVFSPKIGSVGVLIEKITGK